jgi:hypothetical protein
MSDGGLRFPRGWPLRASLACQWSAIRVCGRLRRGWLVDGWGAELRIRNAAAQTRMVSGGWLWSGRRELSCNFKYMARGRIPEFESYHPSHAVVSSAVMTGIFHRHHAVDSRE